MSLESFEQQEESNNRLKVSISFSSSFDLIEPFFKKLTTLLPWIKIETIDFSASKKNASLITCLLIYSLYGDRCETIQ